MAILYKTIANDLKKNIEDNLRKDIHKLPTEAELCKTYRASRQTIRQALSILEEEQLIEKRQGSGIYITGKFSDPDRNRIYIMVSSDQEYLYPTILNDIHKSLSEYGLYDQIFITSNQVSEERRLLMSFLEQPPRGLIVEGCCSARPNPNTDLYEKLSEKGTFIIFLFNHYNHPVSSLYIKGDNAYGSSLLTKHLYEEGHRNIAGIFKSDDMQGVERYFGFIKTMNELGLEVPDRRIEWFNSSTLSRLRNQRGTEFLKRAVKTALSDCTAVICYNDEIAYWLIKELNLAGYKLPDEMAITAFDNTYLSNRGILSITTLSHREHDIGKLVAEMTIKKVKGLPVLSQELPFTLNIKESTSAY